MPTSGLPTTAYLVLGLLAANDVQLTAGEIKLRAELSVGYFYWSPSVSHVRRELNRLLSDHLVSETTAQSGKRTVTLYEATPAGLEVLRGWVQQLPSHAPVVIKHPVILRVWLSRDEEAERIVETLECHLESTRRRLDEALWSRQRTRDLGVDRDPDQRIPLAVLDYSIRSLYAEISNIEQLRDEAARGTAQDPVGRVKRPRDPARRRSRTADG